MRKTTSLYTIIITVQNNHFALVLLLGEYHTNIFSTSLLHASSTTKSEHHQQFRPDDSSQQGCSGGTVWHEPTCFQSSIALSPKLVCVPKPHPRMPQSF